MGLTAAIRSTASFISRVNCMNLSRDVVNLTFLSLCWAFKCGNSLTYKFKVTDVSSGSISSLYIFLPV